MPTRTYIAFSIATILAAWVLATAQALMNPIEELELLLHAWALVMTNPIGVAVRLERPCRPRPRLAAAVRRPPRCATPAPRPRRVWPPHAAIARAPLASPPPGALLAGPPALAPQILINAVAAASLLLFQGLVGFVLGGMQGDEAAVSPPAPPGLHVGPRCGSRVPFAKEHRRR